MSSAKRTGGSVVLSLDPADPVAVLRYSLERRQFLDAVAVRLEPATAPTPRHVTFFEATSFMAAPAEHTRDAVASLLGAMASAGLEIALWIHSDGTRVRFLYGVVDPVAAPGNPNRDAILRNALEGFLPGVRLDAVSTVDENHRRRLELLSRQRASAVIVGVPSARDSEAVERGFAHVLDGLAGVAYDVVVQCAPVPLRELDRAEGSVAAIADLAHRLGKTTMSESDSAAFTTSVAATAGETVSASESTTSSTSTTTAERGTQDLAGGLGRILGAALGAAIGSYVAPGPGTAIGWKFGGDAGALAGTLLGRPQETSSVQTGKSESQSVGVSLSVNEARSLAQTSGRQLSLEMTNRSAAILEEVADAYLQRLRRGRSLGAWHVAVHVLAVSTATVETVAHVVVGALRGDSSHVEPLTHVPYHASSTAAAAAAVGAFRPPALLVSPHPFLPRGEQASTLLSSDDLVHWFAPPSRDTAGVLIRRTVQFARYAPTTSDGRFVDLGPLASWGRPLAASRVTISTDSLRRHAFVAGTTGSGKTTTVKKILHRLQQLDPPVPFLVVEPAKTEYRALFEALKSEGKAPLRLVLGPARDSSERTFALNPFRAPAGVPLGRHAEAMKILLRSCFEMQESLPQLLERVVFATYAAYGFAEYVRPLSTADSLRSFPTLAALNDVVPSFPLGRESGRVAHVVRQLGYEQRVESNLIAALTVRIESFQRGVKASLFGDKEVDFAEILKRPCFLELSDLTEPDVRRFLIGSLLLRLAGEREAQVRLHGEPTDLQHLLVLEEAHHVLRDATGAGPAADLTRTTNTLLADAFAELRAFGQGILVADQAPSELVAAVLRNTATKLIHTLYFEEDCRAMGNAIGLDESQRDELRRLRRGECVVFGPDLPLAVMCQVEASL